MSRFCVAFWFVARLIPFFSILEMRFFQILCFYFSDPISFGRTSSHLCQSMLPKDQSSEKEQAVLKLLEVIRWNLIELGGILLNI